MMASELSGMGVEITDRPDGLEIVGGNPINGYPDG